MDILNEGYGVAAFSNDAPMSDLVNIPEPPAITAPQGAIRNRAAQSALLQGNPDKVVDNFQLMVAEGQQGSSVTHDQIQEAIASQNKSGAMKGVIRILGDKNVPLAQKQQLLNFVRNDNFKEEPSVSLQSKALEEANKGENIRGEAARISTADALGELYKEREDRQKALNGFIAQHPDVSATTVTDLAAAEVLPFGRNIIGAKVAAKLNEKLGVPTGMGEWVKNFLLPGSTRADIQRKLNSIPPENRQAFTNSLLASVKDSAAIFHSDNYYAQYETATALLDEPAATKTAEWASNMSTVLDAFWVTDIIKGVGKAAGVAGRAEQRGAQAATDTVHPAEWELVTPQVPPTSRVPSGQKRLTYNPEDIQKRIELGGVARREHANTPMSIVEQVNPAKAAAMRDTIMASSGDEIAQAMTGVNKEQAVANTIVPQVGTDSEAVLAKANMDLQPFISNTGATRYTADELSSAVDTVVNDFRSASGLSVNDAMTSFRVDGDYLAVDAHYSTAGGAWVTPEAAKAQAQYALREYGVPDDAITVMERRGMEYVPATGNQPGDYIIKVKTRQRIADADVQSWNPLDVRLNWVDRFAATGTDQAGSTAGWLFDPGSMLHPTLTGSFSVATDTSITFERVLLKPVKDLRNMMTKFNVERRGAIEEYMKEANANALKHDPFVLKGRGFNDDEIAALKQWRDIWDGHYYLENLDLVRTMNAQGFQVIDTANTKLFAKPVAKNQNIGKIYDPTSDSVKVLTKDEMDALYNTGGTYAKTRRPVSINGETVDHIVVRNTPSEYLRRIKETDSVLNYREGYYTVNYKAPKFIDEVHVDANGVESRRTVGVAGSTQDADMFAQSMEASTGKRHIVRADNRGFRKDADSYWDLHESSGRIAQRMRGKPLVEASGTNQLGTGPHVENPMKSAVRAAKSIAGRTVMRPTLETAKKRFVKQYSDLLKPTAYGDRDFPSRIAQIVDEQGQFTSRVADARTTWRYIQFMEQGYINSADEIFKGGMQILADTLGKYHLSTGEKAVRAVGDNVRPTHLAKATVFQAYIAMSNPIRQWLVQSHQASRTFAYNPVGWLNGKVHGQAAEYLWIKSNLGAGTKEAQAFTKFVDDSGMVAGVNENSLVRGMGLDMADASYGAKKLAIEAVSLPQRIGFDVGEMANQLGHLSAVYEKYKRGGMNLLDATVRDQAYAEARALSYDLNKAGELHYTQGSAAAILQFLQMPQKALLQTTNRKLPWDVRARLTGWDIIMWGAPVGIISNFLYATGQDGDNVLPDDPQLREIVTDGVTSFGYNKMVSEFDDSGERSRIDFSALKPYDLDGWAKMYSAMMTDGTLGLLAASPTGQILAVDGTGKSTRNGRIPTALLSLGRFFNVIDEIDPQNPTSFRGVLNDVAKITSGWSAADKAMIMLETRKKFNSLGQSVDSYVTNPEVAAAFLGFGTKSEKELYELTKFTTESKKKHEAEVMTKYRDILRYYSNSLAEPGADVQHIQRVSSMLMRTFTDPKDLQLVYQQWQRDMVSKDGLNTFLNMARAVEIPNIEGAIDQIKKAPIPDNQKVELMNRLKAIRAQREYNQQQLQGK
jgi:uncharacterized FlgJ-related protein